jgi:hypothetical protein
VHFHATKKGGLPMISLNFHIFLNSTLKCVGLKINKLCKSCELLMETVGKYRVETGNPERDP